MRNSILELISVATAAICDPARSSDVLTAWGRIGQELAGLLESKNGFYAFESALLVRPLHSLQEPHGLLEWNAEELWKANYQEDLNDTLFFAEDVFGGQFCIRNDLIYAFDPEIGTLEALSSSLAEWAGIVLTDPNFRTGFSVAHEWQVQNGSLLPGMRLLPKVPFVFSGKFVADNLYPVNDVT